MLRFFGLLLCLGGAFFIGTARAAQLNALESESSYYQDVPLVLSATRLSQPLQDIPASVTVIDQAMIRASGAQRIADLLRLVPGFQVSYGISSDAVVAYHGQSTEYSGRLQVLVDGRSVYTPFLAAVPWSLLTLDVDDIERIEVVRGPNAPAYGSNAYLASINIITRVPFQQQGVALKAVGGAVDTENYSFSYGGNVGGRFDYTIKAASRHNDGFDRVYDSHDLRDAEFTGYLSLSSGDSLIIDTGSSRGKMGYDPFNADPEIDPARDNKVANAHVRLKWSRLLDAGDEFSLQLYHNSYQQDDSYRLGPLSQVDEIIAATNDFNSANGTSYTPAQFATLLYGDDYTFDHATLQGTAKRYDLEAQHNFSLRDTRIVWGGGLRLDRYKSDYLVYNHAGDYIDDHSYRLFMNTEWRPDEHWLTNVGAMAEHNDIIGSYVSPRVGVNYHLDSRHTIRFSATHAVHSPSLLEANHDWWAVADDGTRLRQLWRTTSDLDGESNNSFELGYAFQSGQGVLDGDVRLFHEDRQDLIDAPVDQAYPDVVLQANLGDPTITTDVFAWQNSGEMQINGVELQLRGRIGAHTRWYGQYAYAEANGWFINKYNSPFEPVTRRAVDDDTPRRTYSALLSHQFINDIDASLALYSISLLRWKGEGDFVEGYQRWDARVAKKFRIIDSELEVAALLQSIDNRYIEFRDEYVFEERGYLQLRYVY